MSDTCLDCGHALSLCDHAVKRMIEPTLSFLLGVEEETRSTLVAATARIAELEARAERAEAARDVLTGLYLAQSNVIPPTRQRLRDTFGESLIQHAASLVSCTSARTCGRQLPDRHMAWCSLSKYHAALAGESGEA